MTQQKPTPAEHTMQTHRGRANKPAAQAAGRGRAGTARWPECLRASARTPLHGLTDAQGECRISAGKNLTFSRTQHWGEADGQRTVSLQTPKFTFCSSLSVPAPSAGVKGQHLLTAISQCGSLGWEGAQNTAGPAAPGPAPAVRGVGAETSALAANTRVSGLTGRTPHACCTTCF